MFPKGYHLNRVLCESITNSLSPYSVKIGFVTLYYCSNVYSPSIELCNTRNVVIAFIHPIYKTELNIYGMSTLQSSLEQRNNPVMFNCVAVSLVHIKFRTVISKISFAYQILEKHGIFMKFEVFGIF